ncbi:MAG: TRAM domain-containing protein, partial [Saprospiraceae bacterium]
MAKAKKILPNVLISGIADKGFAVGRDQEGQVIFVEGAVPGDYCDVQVDTRKKGVNFGSITRMIEASQFRVDPICEHFGTCGGCKWQHLEYAEQLNQKAHLVENAFRRIGKVTEADYRPIIGAKHQYFYRNKLDFSFSSKRWIVQEELNKGLPIDQWQGLGFHRPGAFDKVVDVVKCHLQEDPSNAIRNFIREYTYQKELSFYDLKKQVGYLRNLLIRTTSLGETMVVISLKYEDEEARIDLLTSLMQAFPQI